MWLHGEKFDQTFVHWIKNRAQRLSLAGSVRLLGPDLIELYLLGNGTLVDAMEVACSLGPLDADVHDVVSTQLNEHDVGYRQMAEFVEY